MVRGGGGRAGGDAWAAASGRQLAGWPYLTLLNPPQPPRQPHLILHNHPATPSPQSTAAMCGHSLALDCAVVAGGLLSVLAAAAPPAWVGAGAEHEDAAKAALARATLALLDSLGWEFQDVRRVELWAARAACRALAPSGDRFRDYGRALAVLRQREGKARMRFRGVGGWWGAANAGAGLWGVRAGLHASTPSPNPLPDLSNPHFPLFLPLHPPPLVRRRQRPTPLTLWPSLPPPPPPWCASSAPPAPCGTGPCSWGQGSTNWRRAQCGRHQGRRAPTAAGRARRPTGSPTPAAAVGCPQPRPPHPDARRRTHGVWRGARAMGASAWTARPRRACWLRACTALAPARPVGQPTTAPPPAATRPRRGTQRRARWPRVWPVAVGGTPALATPGAGGAEKVAGRWPPETKEAHTCRPYASSRPIFRPYWSATLSPTHHTRPRAEATVPGPCMPCVTLPSPLPPLVPGPCMPCLAHPFPIPPPVHPSTQYNDEPT